MKFVMIHNGRYKRLLAFRGLAVSLLLMVLVRCASPAYLLANLVKKYSPRREGCIVL
jgi:hypothetical protein